MKILENILAFIYIVISYFFRFIRALLMTNKALKEENTRIRKRLKGLEKSAESDEEVKGFLKEQHQIKERSHIELVFDNLGYYSLLKVYGEEIRQHHKK